jgi:hypothetical protein
MAHELVPEIFIGRVNMAERVSIKKFEYAIPLNFIQQFKQEARFILPESLVGVWVFPPDFVNKLSPEISKQLTGHTIVAIPNEMLK